MQNLVLIVTRSITEIHSLSFLDLTKARKIERKYKRDPMQKA